MNYLKAFLPYLFGNKKGKPFLIPLPEPIPWESISFEEKLLFHTLKSSLHSFVETLDLTSLSKKDLFHLFNFLPFLHHKEMERIEKLFPSELNFFKEATETKSLKAKEVQELIDFKTGKLTVFAILHADRTKPGVLLIRRADGQFHCAKDGSVWSIPILGMSGRGLPFHHSNGNTPMGVLSIDAVMPEANKQYEFGKHRRLILNFLAANEEDYLPPLHWKKTWWKEAVLARELGRSLLRIHGTGRVNRNFFSPYYPMVPTSGCLATNEVRLFGLKQIHDQRLLLDELMKAQSLLPSFENESKIHGLLYVIEFDDSLSALKF